MARGPRYRVLFRRRRSGKTNFHYRKRLILSNQLRFAIRPSLKNIIVQVIKAELIGDKILSSTHSVELVKNFNWRGGTGNLPAAYLTGFLAGKKALKSNLTAGVLDTGIINSVYGNRVYATLKGLIDAGVDIPHNEKVYPPEERIRGEHIAQYAKYLADQETPSPPQQFNLYKKRGLNPENLSSHFNEIKGTIENKYV
ncbi:MAG: 50S ribosomal protein L18 [Candidatus Helarchaeota archaeon]